MIDVICPFSTASAVHVLDYDGGISRNMFFQKGNCGFYPKISASARRGERDDRDGLAFIEIDLENAKSDEKISSAARTVPAARSIRSPLSFISNLLCL